MGATIAPNYKRQRVEFVHHTCESCEAVNPVSWSDWHNDETDCPYCGRWQYVDSQRFYPTEFEWCETHLTYGTLMVLFGQMGIAFDYAGEIDPDSILAGLPMATDQFGAETLGSVAQCAKMLGVSVVWG